MRGHSPLQNSRRNALGAPRWATPVATAVGFAVLATLGPLPVHAVPARERAVEEIPELMGRILESQEEIREHEAAMRPVVAGYDEELAESRRAIDDAISEEEAAEMLVRYVEAYSARLDTQERGLRSIEGALIRMRADSRELKRAAKSAKGKRRASPEDRQEFFQDQFQGLASATARLAERLGRLEDASTAGAVLHASWASHGALSVPLSELGSEGATAFARKVEGLHARHQARSNQLRAERKAVRRLLDVLVERQLARRLDALFSGDDELGLGALLSASGKSQDWGDLDRVVSRALGLPSSGGSDSFEGPSLDRLEYFAGGNHRE